MRWCILSLLLILSVVSVSSAERIGDIAPLEVGNKWEYTLSASGGTDDSGGLSIQVISSFMHNDTTAYVLRSVGEIVVHQLASAPDSTYSWEAEDTVYEYGDSLFYLKGWICLTYLPVSDKHYLDSVISHYTMPAYQRGVVDSLYEIDGIPEIHREISYCPVGLSTCLFEVRTYRARVGLIYASSSSGNGGVGYKRTITLVSFTNTTADLGAPRRMVTSSHRQFDIMAKKTLSLPHLLVIDGNRRFDLQGRMGAKMLLGNNPGIPFVREAFIKNE